MGSYKFSKGDRVKVVGNDGRSELKIGWIGTVLTDDSVPTVQFDNGPWANCLERRLALVKEDVSTPVCESTTGRPKPKFSVGDKARVIGNTNFYHYFDIGSIVEILTPLDSYGEYHCKNLCGDGTYKLQYVIQNDLERIEEEPESSWKPAKTLTLDMDDFGWSLLDSFHHLRDYYWSPYTHTFGADYGKESKNNNKHNGGNPMQKLSLIAKKAFDKDTKTLIRANVLDSDLEVCRSGFVLSFIVDKYKSELAELAQAELDEEKSDK